MAKIELGDREYYNSNITAQASLQNSHPTHANSESWGKDAVLGAAGATAFGQAAEASGIDAIAIGRGAAATHDGACVIGAGLSSTAADRLFIGKDFDVGGNDILNVGLVDGVDVSAHVADTNNPHVVTLQQAFDAGNLIASTTQGVGIPAMTEAQRDLIGSPATGEFIFNTTSSQMNQYNGSAWTVPGGGLTTLQGAYDNDPVGAHITLDATPNALEVQASVAGDVLNIQDLGGNNILHVTADPDEVEVDGRLVVSDPYLNAGALNSIVLSDTFTAPAFVGGGFLSNGTVTYSNAVFIWAMLQESKRFEATVGPGFAAWTLLNALSVISNAANVDLVQSLCMNVGITHERQTSGTSTTTQNVGVSFAAGISASVSGATMTRTSCNAVNVAPTYNAVSGATVNLGTVRGMSFSQPNVRLFGSGAGTINMTAYYGLDFPNMTFGGASAAYSVVRSQLNSGTNKYCIDHTGNATSRFRGHVQFDVDNWGVLMGASSDVLMRWGATSNAFDILFNSTFDYISVSSPAADRFLWEGNAGNGVSEYNFNLFKMSFGAQSGAVGNQKFAFVSGAETVTVAGDYSGMLWTYAANDTLNAAISQYATATWNAGSPTIGTGSLTNNAVMLIGGNPGSATAERVGLKIISNPTGATLNAALYVTAGRSRFDGIVDINNGVALGGGAAATLGTIGGSGPTAAAQAQWVQIEVNGVNHWIPAWT